MTTIPEVAKKVPMMFRAQVNGRCQLQRLIKDRESDAIQWTDEWIDKAEGAIPDLGTQTRDYTLAWRFVTNGGQDDGVIRPAIGARGLPFYPGSSMKGIFRRACNSEQAARYCGVVKSKNEFSPGILRFQGGYPVSDWTQQLVDIVHPQQDRQVKKSDARSSAFVQISLYKPTLRFGISSTETLKADEWETIWKIWERALTSGLGCRVCAGYGRVEAAGQPDKDKSVLLYRTHLKGQGQAAKLVDGTGEFRPNIFRAGLRGHALRLFGGLTDAEQADRLVDQLFGSVRGRGVTGLLGMSFVETQLELGMFGKGAYAQPTYAVEGELRWQLARSLPPDQTECLKRLVADLMRLAMVLGGFGKSWRRADHRLFFEEYYEEGYKPLIGCHWRWLDAKVRKLEGVTELIDGLRLRGQEWMQLQGIAANPERWAEEWREVWHPSRVQVWGRETRSDALDFEARAIPWLHGPYRERFGREVEGSIYRSSVTGQMGQIGRLWHRMYPVVVLRKKNPQDPNEKPVPRETKRFFELLTLFPDGSSEFTEFVTFLKSQRSREGGFQPLWGDEK